jgi:hypothetical protein
VDTITEEISKLRRTPEELKDTLTSKANQAVEEIATEYQKALENLKSLKGLVDPSSPQGAEDGDAGGETNYLRPAENNETQEAMTTESIFGDVNDDP